MTPPPNVLFCQQTHLVSKIVIKNKYYLGRTYLSSYQKSQSTPIKMNVSLSITGRTSAAEVQYIEISIFNNKLDWSNPDYNLRTQMDPCTPGQQITSFQYQRILEDKL